MGFPSWCVAQIIVTIPIRTFQQEEDGVMTRFDWRDAGSYAEAATYDASALAWEFLRRNPDYHADHDRIIATEGEADIATMSELRRKWGLCFRG